MLAATRSLEQRFHQQRKRFHSIQCCCRSADAGEATETFLRANKDSNARRAEVIRAHTSHPKSPAWSILKRMVPANGLLQAEHRMRPCCTERKLQAIAVTEPSN